MIDQEEEMNYLGRPPLPEITLSVDNTDEIPDELYDFLLDQFVAKAQVLGYDVVEDDTLVLSNWTIKAQLDYV
jgi:hypothetical protein